MLSMPALRILRYLTEHGPTARIRRISADLGMAFISTRTLRPLVGLGYAQFTDDGLQVTDSGRARVVLEYGPPLAISPPPATAPAIDPEPIRTLVEHAEESAARDPDFDGCDWCSADPGEECEDSCGRPSLWDACVEARKMAGLPEWKP